MIMNRLDIILLQVSAYMLELYNDRLQDLFLSPPGEAHAQVKRVEIKRNRKGVVFAQGAVTKEASSAQELHALFQQACANRHIAATSESYVAHFKEGPAKWLWLLYYLQSAEVR